MLTRWTARGPKDQIPSFDPRRIVRGKG
jgi:hypothetical protein